MHFSLSLSLSLSFVSDGNKSSDGQSNVQSGPESNLLSVSSCRTTLKTANADGRFFSFLFQFFFFGGGVFSFHLSASVVYSGATKSTENSTIRKLILMFINSKLFSSTDWYCIHLMIWSVYQLFNLFVENTVSLVEIIRIIKCSTTKMIQLHVDPLKKIQ